jgi:hypothetical protein
MADFKSKKNLETLLKFREALEEKKILDKTVSELAKKQGFSVNIDGQSIKGPEKMSTALVKSSPRDLVKAASKELVKSGSRDLVTTSAKQLGKKAISTLAGPAAAALNLMSIENVGEGSELPLIEKENRDPKSEDETINKLTETKP